MDAVAIGFIALAGLLGAFIVGLLWLTLTGWCCMPIKSCCTRYLLRKVKRKDGRLQFDFDEIDEQLVMGRLPKQPEQLEQLKAEHRVSAIVTLNEVWELPFYIAIGGIMGKPTVNTTTGEEGDAEAFIPGSEYNFCFLPTPDYCAPSHDDISRGVKWIQEHQAAGQTVYVHCNAGRGRSAVIVLCFLIANKGISSDEALEYLRSKRGVSNLKRCCGTRPQWRSVLKYERSLGRHLLKETAGALKGGHAVASGGKGNRVAPLP